MAYLGLRIGEVRDLRWTDILWDQGKSGIVVVRRGGSNNSTKSRRVRRIPLNPELRARLVQLKGDPASITKAGGQHELVFTAKPSPRNPFGGAPIKPDWVRLHLKKLCKQLGFPNPRKYKLHTFRHTFASMCARNNVAYKYALEWMGHTDSKILDLYYTTFDDVAAQAISTITYESPTTPATDDSQESE